MANDTAVPEKTIDEIDTQKSWTKFINENNTSMQKRCSGSRMIDIQLAGLQGTFQASEHLLIEKSGFFRTMLKSSFQVCKDSNFLQNVSLA